MISKINFGKSNILKFTLIIHKETWDLVHYLPLQSALNNSFYHGIFPDELKLAWVVPIFKSGDSSKMYKYRPISILPLKNIYERLMYNKVFNFMNEKELIYTYQFGFRQKHSPQQAIISRVEKITKGLDYGDIVIEVFLDLKKEFDTVNHKII